jgi:gliding motility-associated-like protein
MENEKSKLGELFKKAFNDYKPEPSARVWDKISQRPELLKIPNPGKGFSWWKWLIGGASVTAVILAVVFMMDFNSKTPAVKPLQETNPINLPLENKSAEPTRAQKEAPDQKAPVSMQIQTITKNEQKTTGITPHSIPPLIAFNTEKEKQSLQNTLVVTETKVSNNNTQALPAGSMKMESSSISDINSSDPAISQGDPSPKDGIEVIPSQKICKGDAITLWASGGTTYKWNTGETTETIVVNPSSTANYYVTVTDHSGQPYYFDLTITVVECKSLYVPTAFSPNNDGVNDEFKVKGSDITNFTLRIFSRTSQVIFETKDINEGWDGKIKGDIADLGVYVYQVTYTDSLGKDHKETGQLTLLR